MTNQKNIDLKRIIATPAEEKPRFDWRRLVVNNSNCACEYYNTGEIAEKIGETLVNACLLGGQADIFSDEHKQLVIELSRQVCEAINARESRQPTQALVDEIIEEILVRNCQKDMAYVFVAKSKFENEYYKRFKEGKKLNLIRRDGSIVPWNIEKIKHAVELAFISQHKGTERAEKISRAVTKNILDEGLSFIHIENVQDCVQEELMRQGEYKVAEAYILYRAERAKLRELSDFEKEKISPVSQETIFLIKNGTDNFFWDGSELRKRIEFANVGLDSHLTFDEIFLALKTGVTSDITSAELKNFIVKNSRKLIEKDPVFAVFAARIQLLYLYEDVVGWDCAKNSFEELNAKQRTAFVDYIKSAAESGLLHKDMLKYDLNKLSQVLDVAYDNEFDAIALQGLQDNYFMRGMNNEIVETPQMLWMRVAMGVFLAKEDAEADVISTYILMRDRKFCFATPTLYYAGTPKAQMMSSYIYHIEDDMQSIMTRGISDNAFIAKWGGGIAGSWSNIRGRGSRIAGTRGESPGIIPFLQLHQHQLAIANQKTERRRGRGAAYLEIWHSDVIDFINYKKKHSAPGVQSDTLGPVLWIPDIFMRRLENDSDWTLLNSEDAHILHDLYGDEFEKKYQELEKLASERKIFGQKIACRNIWQKIMQRIFESGYPKIAFKDTCNRATMCKNGIIHSAGLCLEHIMNTTTEETAVCNTAAIDISKHLNPDGTLDKSAFVNTIAVATRALDAIIDANYFPAEAAKNFARKYRAIGLGLMGLQNALYNKNLAFASKEAIEFSEECTEILAYETINESCELAKKYGSCDEFKYSEWAKGNIPCDLSKNKNYGISHCDWHLLRDKIKMHGIRNAYLNAFSPTRKIARLLGCYPELFPATKNVFTKRLDDNYEMMIISPELVKILKKSGIWNKSIHKQIRYFEGELAAIEEIPEAIKSVFATAYLIDSEAIIEGVARRQRWIDQGQALRLFLGSPNLKILSEMFVIAWEKGIKGIYEVKSAGFFSVHTNSDRLKDDHAANMFASGDGSDSTDSVMKALAKLEEERRAFY